MSRAVGLGALLVLFACGGAKPGGTAKAEPKDDRQAICPRALEASGVLDGFAHEIQQQVAQCSMVPSAPHR